MVFWHSDLRAELLQKLNDVEELNKMYRKLLQVAPEC
jgi:hypothetical protein